MEAEAFRRRTGLLRQTASSLRLLRFSSASFSFGSLHGGGTLSGKDFVLLQLQQIPRGISWTWSVTNISDGQKFLSSLF